MCLGAGREGRHKPCRPAPPPVTEGMKVYTHSDAAIQAQKGRMEFMLINHPLTARIETGRPNASCRTSPSARCFKLAL